MLYLAAFGIVLAVNLIPAFGPPSWAVLVLIQLHWRLNAVALVLVGAVAAATGRFLLAHGARLLRTRMTAGRRERLSALADRLTQHRTRAVAGLALFALSPVPSAQLFEAAGVLDVNLVAVTLAFFAGRLASYAIYLSASSLAEHSFGDVFTSALTSPVGVAVQVLMLAFVVALTRVDPIRSRVDAEPHRPHRHRPAAVPARARTQCHAERKE